MTKTATEIMADEFLNGPRHSAQYDAAFDAALGLLGLGKNQEPSPEQLARCQRAGKEADRRAVFGHDYQRDKNGEPAEQGIGSRGHETLNHFRAMLANERRGELAPGSHAAAVAEIWRRDPERAKRIGLPQPQRAAT